MPVFCYYCWAIVRIIKEEHDFTAEARRHREKPHVGWAKPTLQSDIFLPIYSSAFSASLR